MAIRRIVLGSKLRVDVGERALQEPRYALVNVIFALHHDPVADALNKLNLHLRNELLRHLECSLVRCGIVLPDDEEHREVCPGGWHQPIVCSGRHHGEQIYRRLIIRELTLLFLEAVMRRTIIVQRAVHVLIELRNVVIEFLNTDRVISYEKVVAVTNSPAVSRNLSR